MEPAGSWITFSTYERGGHVYLRQTAHWNTKSSFDPINITEIPAWLLAWQPMVDKSEARDQHLALLEFAGISHAWFIEGQAGGAAIEQVFENAQVVRFEADYTIMMDSRQTGTDVPGTRWPTRVGLALAGFYGGLLYLYFLVGFVGLWMRTVSFSPIQILVYFGDTSARVVGARHRRLHGTKSGAVVCNLLMTVWLANVFNIVLLAIGTFTF